MSTISTETPTISAVSRATNVRWLPRSVMSRGETGTADATGTDEMFGEDAVTWPAAAPPETDFDANTPRNIANV
jgi:hypothetical protein